MKENNPEWFEGLSEEDWQFTKRLLLASGSLKEVAKQYAISYPTVRIRLNRIIEKVKILESKKTQSEFHKKVKLLVAECKLELSVAKILIKAHEQSEKAKDY